MTASRGKRKPKRMSDSYAIFLNRPVYEALIRLKGNKKKAIEKFIDYLSDNPFDEGDFTESDESGRLVHCKIIRDYAITYFPDHAVKELKIIELVPTP